MELKYHIVTYGCQMNVHESEKMAGILRKLGYVETSTLNDADLILFNTCCIRENAENHAFGNIGALKKLKKEKPELIIAVGGCMTQEKGKTEILKQKFPFIDIMFGTLNLEELERLILLKKQGKKRVVEIREKEGEIIEFDGAYRTSYPNAWVNIMYGCNNFCTYCIVPYVRGRERSRKKEDIVNECKLLLEEGYKEITLLGQNVNSYGKDLGNVNFKDLISEISELPYKFRLKFMTNHPKDFTDDLAKEISLHKNICPCVHLPVQAGSNKILKMMNRHYTREDYLEKVKSLRRYTPDISITTDIMVGFPSETEKDFNDTFELMKEVEYAGAFTFIYSRRNGTPAATYDNQVDEEISKERIMKLIDLQNSINRKKSKEYEGKTIEILCEGFDDKKNKYLGRDAYGRMAYFDGDASLLGQFVNVKITKAGGISLLGEIQNGEN